VTKAITSMNALVNGHATPFSTKNHKPFRNSHYDGRCLFYASIHVLVLRKEDLCLLFYVIFLSRAGKIMRKFTEFTRKAS
jgi:hypothetical protein